MTTVAVGNPVFHYNGEFDARLALRNLYLEEKGLGLDGLYTVGPGGAVDITLPPLTAAILVP